MGVICSSQSSTPANNNVVDKQRRQLVAGHENIKEEGRRSTTRFSTIPDRDDDDHVVARTTLRTGQSRNHASSLSYGPPTVVFPEDLGDGDVTDSANNTVGGGGPNPKSIGSPAAHQRDREREESVDPSGGSISSLHSWSELVALANGTAPAAVSLPQRKGAKTTTNQRYYHHPTTIQVQLKSAEGCCSIGSQSSAITPTNHRRILHRSTTATTMGSLISAGGGGGGGGSTSHLGGSTVSNDDVSSVCYGGDGGEMPHLLSALPTLVKFEPTSTLTPHTQSSSFSDRERALQSSTGGSAFNGGGSSLVPPNSLQSRSCGSHFSSACASFTFGKSGTSLTYTATGPKPESSTIRETAE